MPLKGGEEKNHRSHLQARVAMLRPGRIGNVRHLSQKLKGDAQSQLRIITGGLEVPTVQRLLIKTKVSASYFIGNISATGRGAGAVQGCSTAEAGGAEPPSRIYPYQRQTAGAGHQACRRRGGFLLWIAGCFVTHARTVHCGIHEGLCAACTRSTQPEEFGWCMLAFALVLLCEHHFGFVIGLDY